MLLQLIELAEQVLFGLGTARRLLAFWGPVSNTSPAIFGPLLAIGSMLTLALLTGVAVGSLSTLIVSGVVLYLLLTEVFGFSFDITAA